MSDAGPHPDDNYECAEDILKQALKRMRTQRASQEAYMADLLDQMDTCRAFLSEAIIGERELERTLANLYPTERWGPRLTDAEVYVPDYWPPEVPKPELLGVEVDRLEDLPPKLVEQLSPAFVEAHALADPYPEQAPPMVRGPYAPSVPVAAVAERIMEALETMLAQWPDTLDAGKVATALGEQQNRVYPALQALHDQGLIQYVRRLDKAQIIVLRPGEPMPHPNLSKKQQALFDTLVGLVGDDWKISTSYRDLVSLSGSAKGGIVAIIDALVAKGYIEITDRGTQHRPATYRIVKKHRPVRETVAEAVVQPEPKSEPVCQPEADDRPLEPISQRRLSHARELIDQGWSIAAAAGRVDADRRSLEAALQASHPETVMQ